MFLHLIVEHMAQYRFLFQDLSNLTGRLPKLARGMRSLINALKRTLAALLASLKSQGLVSSDTQALGQLVEQITLTLMFSLDYQRVLGREGDVGIVVYQVMMLVAPHLVGPARGAAEQLAGRYGGVRRTRCVAWPDAFAGKPTPTRFNAEPVGAGLPAKGATRY